MYLQASIPPVPRNHLRGTLRFLGATMCSNKLHKRKLEPAAANERIQLPKGFH